MDPYIGEIRQFAFNYAPQGWAFCQGQLLSIQDYSALFAIIGTTYGGNGTTNFGLPDLRGRVPVGVGEGHGLPNVNWGAIFGQYSITLTQSELPVHTPQVGVKVKIPAVTASENTASEPSASSYLGPVSASGRSGDLYTTDTPDTSLASFDAEVNVGPVGGGQSFSIQNPSLGMHYAIALEGIFPPRP